MMLGARLVNDEAPECRKMVAQNLKALLGRLPNNTRDQLFDIVMLWLQDSKVSHRQMSVQLCGIFVQVEQKKFERRLVVLVPVLLDQLAPTSCADDLPGRFVRAVPVVESSNWSEEEQHQHDHRLFQTLQTINKICEHCPALLSDAKWSETVQALAGTSRYVDY
uniref:Uncharacterized protein n=1 Tax=Timema shepardi TaxID=629360 RepID=A0A7R9BAD4_TIMSH|nr:unnamed protein product [Timema shepardi]